MNTNTKSLRDAMHPRGNTRIIYHADGHPYEASIPLYPKAEDLHEYVDNLAEAGIEVFSLMGFCGGEVTWKSDLAETRGVHHPLNEPPRYRVDQLWQQGVEPLDVYAKRCHEKGLKFLVKFRMNDNHSGGRLTGHHSMFMGNFIRNHTDWWLKSLPGQLDYTHQGVRDWMFELAREVTTKFDTDGLTYNFIRYPHVFEPEESREKMGILTDFMRQTRAMLDEEGKRKGRKLDLCAIVAPTVVECLDFGMDVPTWIEEGIVDNLCPCHFDNSLFNTAYEEFAEMSQGTDVTIFPALHPSISPYRYYFGYMTEPTYRASARNIYSSGADGVSAFNYYSHWAAGMTIWGAGSNNGKENYPRALHFLSALSDPDNLESGDRHYVFWPLRDLSYFGFADRFGQMTINHSSGSEAEWTIRVTESFDGSTKAMLRMNAVNLVPGDEIEVSINGKPIPSAAITREFHEQGRTNIQEGALLPPYTSVTLEPTSPPFIFGNNRIGIKLTKSADGATGEITVPEFEVAVSASGVSPDSILNMMIDGPYPEPMQTIEGYHPHVSAIGMVIMSGDLIEDQLIGGLVDAGGKEAVTMGAQSFVLDKESVVSGAEICIYRFPQIKAAMKMSIHADNNGAPGEKPIDPSATASFSPWENPEQVCSMLLQGYYKFNFATPQTLPPGKYWLLMEMDPTGQPKSSTRWGDPPASSCYAPVLSKNAHEHYPQGSYMTWNGTEWVRAEKDGAGLCGFFGVV